jgi:hypothetical protein
MNQIKLTASREKLNSNYERVNKKASNDSRFIAIQDLVDLEKIDSR